MTPYLTTTARFSDVRDELVRQRLSLIDSLGDEVDLEQDAGTRAEIDPAETVLRTSLCEFDAAIGRIDAGTYGRCDDCDNAIHADRLQAIPETAYCIDCQARRET